MATNFPADVDDFVDPTAISPLNSPSHSIQHININDAVEAIEDFLIKDVVATENITQYKAVTSNGKLADSVNLTHRGKVVGISLQTVLSGISFRVVTEGEIINNTWTWVAGDIIYLNGINLSTIAPSSGFIQKIGKAKNNTTIIVQLGESILL